MVPSFEVNLLTQRHEICSQETRDSTPSCGRNQESLSYLGLNRYRVVTDGRTDRQTERQNYDSIASTLSHVKSCALARKLRNVTIISMRLSENA